MAPLGSTSRLSDHVSEIFPPAADTTFSSAALLLYVIKKILRETKIDKRFRTSKVEKGTKGSLK